LSAQGNLEEVPQLTENLVEEVFLARNRLSTLDLSRLYRGVRRLELGSNQLRSLPAALFALPRLQILAVQRNCLTSVPDEVAQSGVVILNLSWCPIHHLPRAWPAALKKLYCGYCGFSELPPGLAEVPELELVAASGNSLTALPLLLSATELQLSRNEFETFPRVGGNLRVLNLSFNRLSAVPPLPFGELTDLDVSHNRLIVFPALSAPRLRYLRVGSNPALRDQVVLTGLPSLWVLDVEGTQIVYESVPKHNELRELVTGQSDAGIAKSGKAKLMRRRNGIGFSEMNGARDQMEDALVVRAERDFDTFCVFDGHGGPKTAYACAFRVPNLVRDAEPSLEFVEHLFATLTNSIRKRGIGDGATAVIALHRGDRVWIGHLGDARAVVVSIEGTVGFETNDHKPSTRTEFERIRDCGARVSAGRVDGTLAVARSIGDLRVLGISHEPELNEVHLGPDDRWLILACDGVWDVFTPAMLHDVVETAGDASELATDIKNLSYSLGSRDNISVIAVDLHEEVS
jgi:adenylate cyclase